MYGEAVYEAFGPIVLHPREVFAVKLVLARRCCRQKAPSALNGSSIRYAGNRGGNVAQVRYGSMSEQRLK